MERIAYAKIRYIPHPLSCCGESNNGQALKRAALAAFIEAADALLAPAGPIFAGLGTLVRELRAAQRILP